VGLVSRWADDRDDAPTPINARGETAHEKNTFRQSFAGAAPDGEPDEEAAGRCPVLADGFYEWARGQTANGPTGSPGLTRTRSGLWTRWQPPGSWTGRSTFAEGTAGREPELRQTFAIMTCDANETVDEVHDRMPVVPRPGVRARVADRRSGGRPGPAGGRAGRIDQVVSRLSGGQ
jgi:putative SOS response-associated peptidase YedK